MAIKVFISHKLEDAQQAKAIADRLRNVHQIDSYVDVLDPVIGKTGEELARYVRAKLATYGGTTALPDFLKKWPVLKSEQNLDAYARASQQAHRERLLLERTATASTARKSATQEFYRSLRSQIGQLPTRSRVTWQTRK